MQSDDEIIAHFLSLFEEVNVTHVEHVKSAHRVHDFVPGSRLLTLRKLEREERMLYLFLQIENTVILLLQIRQNDPIFSILPAQSFWKWEEMSCISSMVNDRSETGLALASCPMLIG